MDNGTVAVERMKAVPAALPNEDSIVSLPPELADLEQTGLEHERRRREREEAAIQDRERRKQQEAAVAWESLLSAATADLPPALLPFIPQQVPAEFVATAMEWDLEIPLPGGRPHLVARYSRYLAADGKQSWRRGQIRSNPWAVLSWAIETDRDERRKITVSHRGLNTARDLPAALAIARMEARHLQKLEQELVSLQAAEEDFARQRQAEEERRAAVKSEPSQCVCTSQERALLDALSDYCWSAS